MKRILIVLCAVMTLLLLASCSLGADIEGVSLEDASFTYDGTEKSIAVTGELPKGVTVTYEGERATDAGTYEVTATLSGRGYKTLTLNATMTINKATLTGITLENKSVNYTMSGHSMSLTGEVPEGVEVKFLYNNKSKERVKSPGEYEVSATLTSKNYETLTLTATLKINGAISVPEYKDYKRDTIDFKDMLYARPDFESLIADFEAVIEKIESNTLTYEEQLAAVFGLDDGYIDAITMYSMAEIMSSIDKTSETWLAESKYVKTNYPNFVKAIEDLFVAAANSPHAESFEDDYFGDGLIEEYKDGSIYTDAMVELMADEAENEAQYEAISPATVEITYKGVTDTFENILNFYADTYGTDSTEYTSAYSMCNKLYTEKSNDMTIDILVELFKVRKLIANELGNDSYLEYGYDSMGHDYTEKQATDFIYNIINYIVPVYFSLMESHFNSYYKQKPDSLDRVALINDTYEILQNTDEDLAEAFGYMLQHGLYDIELYSDTRYEGAFTTYIERYNAPYIFMSTSGDVTDYITLFHEFGHFYDSYINYGSDSSIDLAEVSSQGLQLLAISELGNAVLSSDMKYLKSYLMDDALTALIYQGFYALFEHFAYELDYDQITEENLNAQVQRAASTFGCFDASVNNLEYVLIPHIVLYPYYVQSYCVSMVASLSIFKLEIETDGAGWSAYKTLLDREDDNTFDGYLNDAGIPSPFEDGAMKRMGNFIHYYIAGKNYFNS